MTTIDLDEILVKLCKLVLQGQETDPDRFGMVGACIIGPNGKVGRTSYNPAGQVIHAENAAIHAYEKKYGPVSSDCVCVTTLSPCCNEMKDRFGESCTAVLNSKGITQVYAGYRDPTQTNSDYVVTDNTNIQELCKRFADTFLKEGVAEGQSVKQEIEEFLDSLTPDDVGVEEFPGYRVHFEGFTDDCKSSGDYRRNPDAVYQQVYQDFVDREHGRTPIESNMVGDEEYPILYSIFRVKQGVAEGTELPGDFNLMGQNLFLKNLARNLKQRYPDATVKLSSDRVTAYHNKGDDEALSVMGTEVMDSGYIGVGLDDAFTESFQGVLVPTIKQTTEQLLAANPGTRPALFLSTDNWNPDAWTHIADKLGYRLVADDESLDENFADGRNPGRKGLAKRSGVNTKASVSSLRKTAKNSSGEKQRMAHWLANMKAGRAKARKE
jgi:pyrimidine deaminase RibD-like protein